MKKKTKKKVGFIIAAAITIPTAIIVFALLYFSNTAINPFHEGKANIQIQENKESPSDMIDDIAMKWKKSESFDYYECDKLVTLTSQYDDQNLRLMLIPSWWKENTPVAGLADNSYNDFSYMRINRTTVGYTVELTLDVYSSKDKKIFSYVLDTDSFNKTWEISSTDEKIRIEDFYLHYIGNEVLPKGNTTDSLIKTVRISEEVYQTMYPDYELHIDVIADAIENYGDAEKIRNF